MQKKSEEFVFKNFSKFEFFNGVWMKRKQKRTRDDFVYALQIYPNGLEFYDEDCASIALDMTHRERKKYLKRNPLQTFSSSRLVFVVSVVDKDGNSRFSQSFGMDLETRPLLSFLPVRMNKFVKRDVLLDASEELLPGDTLTVRCDVADFSQPLHTELGPFRHFRTDLLRVAREESWYTKTEDGSLGLDLRNVHSPLCTRLREQSDFFEALFRSPCKEMAGGCMPIKDCEFNDFETVLGYVRFGSLLNVRFDSEFHSVYKLARLYGVRDLEEICISHFKQNLRRENAIEVLRIADSRGNFELRVHALKEVFRNWEDTLQSAAWADLCLEWPQLANEISCTAHILDLDNRTSLCSLAARQVLLNREKVEQSSTWAIFSKKLPNLAHVISDTDFYEVLIGKKEFTF